MPDLPPSSQATRTAMTMRALDPARLRPLGSGRADASTWLTRAAACALLSAVLWAGYAALRPLPAPAPPPSAAAFEVPGPLALRAVSTPERDAALSVLVKSNPFSAQRTAWAPQPASEPAADAPSAASATASAPPTPAPQGDDAAEPALPPLPEDVKLALANLELKGVYRTPDGRRFAKISFVHSPQRTMSTSYEPGQEFTDEKFPDAPWRVERVDTDRGRVVLLRAQTRAVLAMYARDGLAAEPLPSAPAPSAALERSGPPRVERATTAEVIAQLQQAGVPDAQISQLLNALAEPEDQDAQAITAAPADAAALPAASAGPGERRAPPPGLEGIFRMMSEEQARRRASGQRRPGDASPAQPPTPAPPEPPAPR